MILDDALVVADRATWRALHDALDRYRDAGAALAGLLDRPICDHPGLGVALEAARVARADVHTCWTLHFGRPLVRERHGD